MENKLVLVGGGGHCRSIISSINMKDYSEITIVDSSENFGKQVDGVFITGTDSDLQELFDKGYHNAFIAVGTVSSNLKRQNIYYLLKEIGFSFPSVIDSSAVIASSAVIGDGVFSSFTAQIQSLSKDYNVVIKPIYVDFSDNAQIKNAAKIIISSKQPVDVLVNNAGITYNALFQMSSLDKMQEIFQINYFAPMILSQYIVKLMIKHGGGSIINLSSSAAIDSNSGRSVYGASKAAILCSTRTIATELGSKGIRANCIAPGITNTAMVAESMSEEVINDTVAKTMLKRIGKPIDIANTALFLASDLSSYITGQVIRVDGGLRR